MTVQLIELSFVGIRDGRGSGEYSHSRVQQLHLPTEPLFAGTAGTALNALGVDKVGNHYTKTKLRNDVRQSDDGQDLLVNSIAEIVKILRAGNQVFVIDQHGLQVTHSAFEKPQIDL